MKRLLLIASLWLVSGPLAAQIVNVTSASFPGPPATSCTNTDIDVNMQLLCINAQFSGTSTTVTGNVITVNVEYLMGPICLGAIATPSHLVAMGMIPSGTYTVNVNGVENGSIVSTITTSLSVASCCSAQSGFTMSADTICQGDSIQLTSSATGAQFLNWFEDGSYISSSTSLSRSYSQAGLYQIKMVVGDTAVGCADSTTKSVFVKSLPTVAIGGNNMMCPDGSTVLSVNGNQFDNFIWSDNSTDTFLVVNAPGTYYVDAFLNGCPGRDSMVVSEYAVTPVDLGADTIICMGDTMILDVSSYPGMYLWQDNSTASTYTVFGPALFYVQVTDNNGCVSIDSINVNWEVCDFSVDESSSMEWLVYPNPAKDRVTISTSQLMGGVLNVTLTDMNGRTLINKEQALQPGQFDLSLNNLSKGIYLLKISDEVDTWTVRVVKE